MNNPVEESTNNADGGKEKTIKALTVVHMQGPILIYIFGTIMSIVAFVGEKMYASIKLSASPVLRNSPSKLILEKKSGDKASIHHLYRENLRAHYLPSFY